MANGRRAAQAHSLPVASIVHLSRGRTRLRLADHREAPEALTALGTALARLEPVESVEVRPLTGSLLVRHAGDFREIARLALGEGLFDISGDTPGRSRDTRPAVGLPAVAAAAFAGLGVMQLFQSRVLPPALTLFWYAATLAREARDAGTDTAEE